MKGVALWFELCFSAQDHRTGGIVVADKLKADPVALNNASDDMLNSVGEAALNFVSHEDGLVEAAPGWIGSSQQALGELTARWEARHAHHKLQVGRLGTHVADAMVRYVANEDDSAQAIRSVGE